MKIEITLIAAVLGLAVTAGIGSAMQPTLPRSSKVFAKLDANSDGKITVAEIQPKAEKRFLSVDSDKNGEVSTAEIDAALHKALVLRRKRILRDMDADTDGTVTKAELDIYLNNLIKAADTNGDGGVTFDEARNFRVAKLRKMVTGDKAN